MYPLTDSILTHTVANATDAANEVLLVAPYDLRVVSIRARHKVASTSGTMDLVKAVSGTALSAGTTLLTTPMLNSGAADTTVDGSLLTTIGSRDVPKGSALGFVFAGTLTNLINLDITVVVRQVKKNQSPQ